MKIMAEVSVGELIDKMAVLEVKKEKLNSEEKLIQINKELSILKNICEEKLTDYEKWIAELKLVNNDLWEAVETLRRNLEKNSDREIIEASRQVEHFNYLRFKIKDKINDFYDSEIKEQKSYKES